jgi:hypothetical protein
MVPGTGAVVSRWELAMDVVVVSPRLMLRNITADSKRVKALAAGEVDFVSKILFRFIIDMAR